MNRLAMVVLLAGAALAGVHANAQPVTTIYSFNHGPATPMAGLTLEPGGNFYGTAYSGGAYNDGILFEITTNGNLTTLVNFGGYDDGSYPAANLVLGSDGNFYGTTSQGGTNLSGSNATGTVNKVTTNGTVTVLANFNGANGGIPLAGLTPGPDGNFYGTTEFGGSYGDGTVFKITTNGTLTTLVTFNGTNGNGPIAGLTFGPGGKFYGTTRYGGGTNGGGTVFAVTTNGTFNTLIVFGGTNGAQPYGAVTVGPDGNLYGTTAFGGEPDGDLSNGSIFELTTNGVLTTLVRLADFGGTNGSQPYAGLTLGSDGNFYGTTSAGGAYGNGTVFQVSTNGTLAMLARIPGITVQVIYNSQGYEYYTTNDFNTIAPVYNGTITRVYSFSAQTNYINADGAEPQATVTFGPDGLIYGTASGGGTNGYGTVFKVTTNGTFSTLASFSGNNGYNPMAALTVGPDGNFYGTTSEGGTVSYGALFKMTPAGAVTTVVNFDRANDGSNPEAGLTVGPGGNLYGTAMNGGNILDYIGNNTYNAVSDGTAFALTTNGVFTPLVDFNGTNGANPNGGLAVGLDGNLYGTTTYGGISNDGAIFMLQTNGTVTSLTNFVGVNGANPFATLTLGPDGNFYGTCEAGGSNDAYTFFQDGDGTIFQVKTNGTLTTLVYFNGTNGLNPNDSLLLGPDGNFYGTTVQGGTYNDGTVFKMTPGGTLTTLVNFSQTNGGFPFAGLALGPDGYFYGTTQLGGMYGNSGTVFKMTTNGTLTILYGFVYNPVSSSGGFAYGNLTLATNGNFIHFYGTTSEGGGGGDNDGTIFRLELSTAYAVTENSTNTFFPLTNEVVWTVGGTLGLVSASPTNGTAQISGSGIIFTPAANFTGTAAINYTVTDHAGGTNHSFISVLVTNIPPVANPDFYTVAENSSANVFSPLTNDVVGTSGGTLGLVSVSPTNGTASISGTNVLFTPQVNFTGTATIGYTITDNVGGTNSSLITVTVVNLSADLSLSASAAPEPVTVGSNLVYSLTVSNTGPVTATSVVISNQLPANATFVSATGGATPSGGVLLVNLASLAAGATGSAQIVVQPTTAGQLTNMFAVSASQTDPNLANNSATVITTVTNAAPTVILYNVVDLGLTNEPISLNNQGEIVGATHSSGATKTNVGLYWTNWSSLVLILSQPGGSTRTSANHINNYGQIVGELDNPTPGEGLYWSNGPSQFLNLGGSDGAAIGMNDSGQIAGTTNRTTDGKTPVYWANIQSAPITLRSLGGTNGDAISINASGAIVGDSQRSDSLRHASFWLNNGSTPVDLGTFGGTNSEALSINNPGNIVGGARTSDQILHAAFWTNSSSAALMLADFGGISNLAACINASGQIVGVATTSGTTHATLWTNGTSPIIDLNNVISPTSGWLLLEAVALNDLGEIVGVGITNDELHGFALIPVNPPPSADLSITATASTNSIDTFVGVVYSITVSNAGPSTATGVVVSNQIPASVNFVSATGGATPSGNVLLVNVGTLAVGATNLIQITVLPQGAGGQLTNVFTISGNQLDPVPANNSATLVTNVIEPENTFFTTSTLSVTDNIPSTVTAQTTNLTTVLVAKMPNGTVVYSNNFTTTFSDPSVQSAIMLAAEDLTNSGASGYTGPTQTSSGQGLQDITSLTVTNLIGTNFTTVTTEYVGPTNIMVGPNQSEELALTPGQDDFDTLITFFETNDVVTTNTSIFTNTAVYAMTGIVTAATADLTITASSAPNPVGMDNDLTYSITVSNGTAVKPDVHSHALTPGTATDVIISNQLPADVLFVSATGGATPVDGLLLINLGTLPENATSNAQIVVEPLAAGQLTNLFMVYADQPNIAPSNNTATVVTTVTNISSEQDLSIAASAASQPVGVGSNLVYSIIVSNNTVLVGAVKSHAGIPGATDVTISNRIPAGVTFVSATGGATPVDGLLLINLGSLGIGQTNGVQIVVQPTVAGKLTNVFMVYADQPDPVPSNNVATVISTVTNPPPPTVDVALSIVSAPNPVDVGAALTYSLTATNNSPNTATGVVVSNTLPSSVTFESALPSQGTATNKGSLVTYNIGTLPNGAAATIAIVVIPNAAGQLTNKAAIYSAQTDSNPANNSVTNITTAVSVPITNLVVTVLSGITLNKQTGLYEQQVEISNGGPNTPASVLLLVNGLTGGATLYNATGKTNGVPYVQSAGPLGVGANIVFLLEYYSPTRTMPTHLTFTAEPGPPINPPVITGTVISVSRTVDLAGGDILVEFAAIPGRLYAIQYSSDMVTWQTAVPVITAPANRVQWIDAGPPQTASSPASVPARYYRVILLP